MMGPGGGRGGGSWTFGVELGDKRRFQRRGKVEESRC